MGDAVTNDVGAVLRSLGRCGEGGESGKGKEGIGTSAGVCACVYACKGASNIASASVTICKSWTCLPVGKTLHISMAADSDRVR